MTARYIPMLAKAADAPFSGSDWLFEVKWDGIRAIAYTDGPISLRSRNDREISGQFPELAELATLAPGTVLDGEIVAMRGGKPDIQSLLPRLQAVLPPRAGAVPVTYIVFDILERNGRPLLDLPLVERKRILKEAVQEGPHITISEPVDGQGEAYYRAALEKGLEGIVAKRKDSRYEPGQRTGAWVKIKHQRTCDCIVAGYTRGQGGRSPVFGALVLALYEDGMEKKDGPGMNSWRGTEPAVPGVSGTVGPEKRLVYIGKVGTGFREEDLVGLMEVFAPHVTGALPLSDFTERGDVVWLEPVFVCEVAYQEVTRDRKLRIPRFIRMRPDKLPEECTTDQLHVLTETPTAGKQHARGTAPETGPPVTAKENAMKTYDEKRDFSRTREPAGTAAATAGGHYFVVQEHHAHHLHWDLRLERDGVLKSWAVPKGVPEAAGEKHLAVAVEDHPLDYGHFEGEIPAGEYGAGTVSIWDNGSYDTVHWDDDKIEVVLHGKRLNGRYALIRFKRAGKNEWLVFRAGD